MEKKKNAEIAIFWDYENVKVIAEGKNAPLAESLINYASNRGNLRVMKMYANWARMSKIVTQALYSLGFDPIHISMGKANSADIKLTVDVMGCVMTRPEIEQFLIITGDKDFIPLVNWLKLQMKKVIIIGDPQIVSEHLLMSADEFLPLKSLSKQNLNVEGDSQPENEELEHISFGKAVECLKSVIKKNRSMGKSTRFLIVDQIMRASEDFNYNGSQFVYKPDSRETFSSFGSFIDNVEEMKMIKSETIEGFRELFLISENPNLESEFSPELLGEITAQDIPIIYDQIKKAFDNRKKKNILIVPRNFILAFLGNLKEEKNLKYTSQAFGDLIDLFCKLGILIPKEEDKYNLSAESDSLMKQIQPKLK